MRTMTGRAAALVIIVVITLACTPTSTAGKSVASPSPSGGYLGSIGTTGCKPAATFHYLGGAAEAGIDTSRGSVWALFFTSVPPTANQEIKVSWRMTGAGDFAFQVSDAQGKTVPLVWSPEGHVSSSWNHPGNEVGTGFKFPHSGCWQSTSPSPRLTLTSGSKSPVSRGLRPDRRAQPDRPGLHARDRQDAAFPGIVCEAGTDLRLAIRLDDKQVVVTVTLADGAAENDEALLRERIRERRVFVPFGLLAPTPRVIPDGPVRAVDQVVIGGAAIGPALFFLCTDAVRPQLRLPPVWSATPSSAAPRAETRSR